MKKFIFILLITLAVGMLPSLIVGTSTDGLILPDFYPPRVLFPIVWTIIYILMSISLYLSTKKDDSTYKIYACQLGVNSLWTFIFFGLKLRLFAFVWLIFLFILAIIMFIKMIKINKLAALLQIPYMVWLSIASYLNLMIYLLNK